jgi:hypothetical protein
VFGQAQSFLLAEIGLAPEGASLSGTTGVLHKVVLRSPRCRPHKECQVRRGTVSLPKFRGQLV